MINALESSSLRPYLIRALHEWCTDNGFTPYLAVQVDESVQVPREYVKNGEIVLNVSYDATSALKLGNDFIEFKARFGGKPRDISVPSGRVLAIYARENGEGMAFPPVDPDEEASHPPESFAPPVEEARVVQLVPEEGAAESPAAPIVLVEVPASAEGEDEPPKPSGPSGAAASGGRPALKRIK